MTSRDATQVEKMTADGVEPTDVRQQVSTPRSPIHSVVDLRENSKSISHRCYLREVGSEWELT